MSPRHDSASEITLPRATALLAPPSGGLPEPAEEELTRRRSARPGHLPWHVELELDRDQIARLHRLGFAHSALVWREGLPSWRPLLEVEELRTAIDDLRARAPSSMKSALRRATVDRITSMSRSISARSTATMPRKRMATDPALRLYASLNRRRPPQHEIDFAPLPKISVAVAQPAPAVPAPKPAPVPVAAPTHQQAAQRYGLGTLVAMSLGAAIVTAAVLLWFGPLRPSLEARLEPERRPSAPPPAIMTAPARPSAAPLAAIPPASPVPSADGSGPKAAESREAVPVLSLSTERRVERPKDEIFHSQPKARARAEADVPARSSLAGPAETASPEPRAARGEPDRGQIARALGAAASAASDCGVSGSVRVVVTFGTSGVVRKAAIEGPLPELTDRSCLLRTLSRAKIPPFNGEPISVRKTVRF